ncbi:MAG TPA: glycosyl hydrolase [Saprospiraceae bacterium]|nr:glycosyl hydrolase [Saprospiraceae bacterium]
MSIKIRLWMLVSIALPHILNSQNVLISNEHNPNEPSITLDPKNPARMMAASNINNYYISTDTGRTWTASILKSSLGVWGDPCLAVDTAGNFYFFHLSNPDTGNWIDRIICQKTSDHGNTWNDGSFTGLNEEKAQDKQWCAIDPVTNTIYMTWTQFDVYGSSNPNDSSTILFSKSTDEGETWTTPIRLNQIAGDCVDSDNTTEGAVPAVGPEGEVYVSWAGPKGLVFNRSFDGGKTWLPHESQIDPMPFGWDHNVSGIFRANGLPITLCDLSNGPNRGTIYICWADQRNGENDTDIWFAKSTDKGDHWSAPQKINDDTGTAQQFFPWMTIDQTNGNLYSIFYDRRNRKGDSTDVFLAFSIDGGQNFTNKKISDSPFVPSPNVFFGDYTNITAHAGIVRPIWTRLHKGQLSIWTDLLTHDKLLSSQTNDDLSVTKIDFENYPNPGSEYTSVSYKLRKSSKVSIILKDLAGNTIYKFLDQEPKEYGKYVERLDTGKLQLASATYVLQIYLGNRLYESRKIIIHSDK